MRRLIRRDDYPLTPALIQLVTGLDVGWNDYSGLIILNRHYTYSDSDLVWWVTRGTPVHSPYRFFMLCEYGANGHEYSSVFEGDEGEFHTDMAALRILRG
ncbi:MAG: hypothetical protein EOP83_16270 [Verrucomicrobiaceae bacterium]|nr:MAG: hypothetical protein EOP83_16270 [Verrucomicrobiaceae bacterium]